MWIFNAFIIVSILLAIVDCVIGHLAGNKEKTEGKRLRLTCFMAAGVSVFYVASILSKGYLINSIFSSLYFIGVDVLLLSLIWFTQSYTKLEGSGVRIICRQVSILCLLDILVYLINPFYEFAISYQYNEGYAIASYSYIMKVPYIGHLVLTYGMVIVVLIMLFCKSISISREYRSRYNLCIICILVIVALNAIFLYLPGDSLLRRLDVSTAFYSIAAMVFYYCAFSLIKRNIMRTYERAIYHNFEQGIMLFDYDDSLILVNEKSKTVLKDLMEIDNSVTLQTFTEKAGINELSPAFAFQIYVKNGDKQIPIRCEYKDLKDRNGKLMGHMFVLSDGALEADSLTGFHNWQNFKHMVTEKNDYISKQSIIVAFDINSLSLMNKVHGRSEGDRAIKSLAEKIKDAYKLEGYYIRGSEATLIVIVRSMQYEEVCKKAEEIKNSFEKSIQFAVGRSESGASRIIEDIKATIHAMEIRKIMDRSSAHSAILTSLVKALQEYDPTTEAHVKRTQIMGRKLAKSLELSDDQLAQLELLCILHDIGKIGIPLEILNKPGKLSKEEWDIMKSHTEKGWAIANSAEEFKPVADMILHHHERWDGRGYPNGLSKESIPLLSRIISIIDAFDAMTNKRPYMDAMNPDEAIKQLCECAGTMFDPGIVSEFVKLYENGDIDLNAINNMVDSVGKGLFTGDDAEESSDDNNCLNGESGRNYVKAVADINNIIGQPEEIQEVSYSVFAFPMEHSAYLLDANEKIIKTDENFTKITGYTENDVAELNLCQKDLIPKNDIIEYYAIVSKLLGQKSIANVEHRIICKDGTIKYVFCIGRQYFDSAVRAMRTEIIICDSASTKSVQIHIAAEKESARIQLRHWENTYRTDSMTGILTHGAFINDVEEALIKTEENKALLIMDVDNFKKFNDTFGHKSGDQFLIILANALSAAVGDKGFSGRLGGDEFGAMIQLDPKLSENEARGEIQRIYYSVSGVIKQNFIEYGISMGAAFTETEGMSTFNKLYEAADAALYRSKNSGKNKCTFA